MEYTNVLGYLSFSIIITKVLRWWTIRTSLELAISTWPEGIVPVTTTASRSEQADESIRLFMIN